MIGLLDRVEPDRGELAPADRLALVTAARQVSGRVEALLCTLVAEAEAGNAAMRAKATPLSSWLALSGTVSKREAAGLVHRAREVAGHDRVRQAALAGEVGVSQARAIAGVLNQLPAELDKSQREQAENLLVGLAERLDAGELARSSGRVLAAVSPQTAADNEERRLQRQAELAHRRRGLRFFRDAGSVRFDGSLPQSDAEAWMALLDAHAESQRRAVLEARDPLAPPVSPEQRRADALIGMIAAHQVGRQAPASGGDRPRVVVFLEYDRLHAEAAGAGLIADGAQLSAGELRRLCCDAGILPAVLAGESELLDVGREHRLVTPGIRAALTARDRGCAFPTCNARPAVCEAHHILPWWKDGITALSNLVLLCHHHHALVEPAKHAMRDQWQVRIGPDGLPEFIPPRRMDPERTPMRHQRFRAPHDKDAPGRTRAAAEGCGRLDTRDGAAPDAGGPRPNTPPVSERPAQLARPAQPDRPARPAQPAQPDRPARPAQPTQPDRPAQPAQPPGEGRTGGRIGEGSRDLEPPLFTARGRPPEPEATRAGAGSSDRSHAPPRDGRSERGDPGG